MKANIHVIIGYLRTKNLFLGEKREKSNKQEEKAKVKTET